MKTFTKFIVLFLLSGAAAADPLYLTAALPQPCDFTAVDVKTYRVQADVPQPNQTTVFLEYQCSVGPRYLQLQTSQVFVGRFGKLPLKLVQGTKTVPLVDFSFTRSPY